MSLALDYTAPIPTSVLKAAGVTDVCRYLCWLPVGDWKVIRQAEYDALVNAGIRVHLNWEYADKDWLSGAVGGSAHGKEAVRQASALGYPKGDPKNSVIIGSNDIDMTYAQWVGYGRAYARAYAYEVRAGGYFPGMYGTIDAIGWCADEGFIRAFWQSMSTAYSEWRNKNLSPHAQLWQRRTGLLNDRYSVDFNDIIHPLWELPKMAVETNIKTPRDIVTAVLTATVEAGYADDGQSAEHSLKAVEQRLTAKIDAAINMVSQLATTVGALSNQIGDVDDGTTEAIKAGTYAFLNDHIHITSS